jgi:hypothetical protein
VAAALSEAIAFAVGPEATIRTLEIEMLGDAPVGGFLDLEAHVEGRAGQTLHATGAAHADGQPVARARATYSS